MNTNNNESPFGEIIYSYTRKQAIADGQQIDVTTTAKETGIRIPVFLTRAVYDAYVTVPPGATGQDEAGRLWDIVWMLRFALIDAQPGQNRLPFALYVRNDSDRLQPVEVDRHLRPPRHRRPATLHHHHVARRGLTARSHDAPGWTGNGSAAFLFPLNAVCLISANPITGGFMTLDQGIALFSATIAFVGLVFVGFQLRDGTRQQRSQSIVEIYGVNRELISLGFSHPQLFEVLADAKKADPILERRYLQLWLNHFSLVDTYLTLAVLKGDLKESLVRDLTDFMTMHNAQRHWQKFGQFYPASFQKLVDDVIKKNEPPEAAHAKHLARNHEART